MKLLASFLLCLFTFYLPGHRPDDEHEKKQKKTSTQIRQEQQYDSRQRDYDSGKTINQYDYDDDYDGIWDDYD